MRKLAFLLVAVCATIVMSCGNSAQREQEIRDSLRADSIMKDSIRREQIKLDSIRQDSMWRFRVTPDLALFNLHGPVKSVRYKKALSPVARSESNSFMSLLYEENGQLKNVKDEYDNYSIKRDGNGYVVSMAINSLWIITSYSYNEQGYPNRKYSQSNSDESFEEKITYEYDLNWNVVKESLKGESYGAVYNSTTTNKIEEVDEYGNWIKRTRIITYRSESPYDDGYDPITKGTKTMVETRTITYYDREK